MTDQPKPVPTGMANTADLLARHAQRRAEAEPKARHYGPDDPLPDDQIDAPAAAFSDAAEVAKLRGALFACYRLAQGGTDDATTLEGTSSEALARIAVANVRDMRMAYDQLVNAAPPPEVGENRGTTGEEVGTQPAPAPKPKRVRPSRAKVK